MTMKYIMVIGSGSHPFQREDPTPGVDPGDKTEIIHPLAPVPSTGMTGVFHAILA
jgi:hypothetical protein